MNKIWFLAPVLTTIVACTPAMEITSAPVSSTTHKGFAKAAQVGTTTFTARAFSKAGTETTELGNVPCKLEGLGFSSKFTTPSDVVVPNMGPSSAPIRVICTHDGQTATSRQEPVNVTVRQIHQSGANQNGGLLGALVATAITSSRVRNRDASQDVYGYDPVKMYFEVE